VNDHDQTQLTVFSHCFLHEELMELSLKFVSLKADIIEANLKSLCINHCSPWTSFQPVKIAYLVVHIRMGILTCIVIYDMPLAIDRLGPEY
jgi:hypothetical protein